MYSELNTYWRSIHHDHEEEKFEALAVEPLSWTWLGLKLAEGAVAWAGGKALGALIGGGVDFDRLIDRFVQAVRAVVRAEIRAEALRSAIAQSESAQNLFLDYIASGDRALLPNAITLAESSSNDLESLGLAGHHAFIIAKGFQIAVLQEAYGSNAEFDERIMSRARRGSEHLDGMHSAWRRWHETRYFIKKKETRFRGGPDNVTEIWTFYVVYRDGGVVESFDKDSEAQNALASTRESDWNTDIHPKHIAPSLAIQKLWNRIAQGRQPG